jgi:hypothetical protein
MNLTLTAAERRAASLAALLGNALEWFDFAVYGYVATSLGKTSIQLTGLGCRLWLLSVCSPWAT